MVTRFLLISTVCALLVHAEPLAQRTGQTDLASLRTGKPSGAYFEAEMQMRTILYPPGASADESDFEFKIYQNPDNIVRLEMVSGPRSGGVGEGRDVHIIDYGNEGIITYDKGKNIAFQGRLQDTDTLRPSPSATKLGDLTILGYRCAGSQDTIKHPRGSLMVTLETWFASDSPFKTPLLVIIRTVSPDGVLSSLSVRTVKSIRTTAWLDPGLFQVPSSYRIVGR